MRGPPPASGKPAPGKRPAARSAERLRDALSLLADGKLDAAQSCCDAVLAIEARELDALHISGLIALRRGDPSRAVKLFNAAIRVNPGEAMVYNNRGLALQDLHEFDAAMASFDRAITFRPDYADAYFHQSLVLLLTGDFDRGWKLHEWRRKLSVAAQTEHTVIEPGWLCHDLTGKTLLLYSEQGLGDTIMFSRYAKLAAQRGAKVILAAPAPLVPLLATLADGIESIEIIEAGAEVTAIDYLCALHSAPLAFATRLETIPFAGPYLHADPARISTWETRLGARTRPRIGIAWSGNPSFKSDHTRSMHLAQLLAHLPASCEYVALQNDIRAHDRAAFDATPSLRFFGDDLRDFSDTAALCSLMDVVVSVDTSIAHLAGALGKPCWIMLPYLPDWRWLLGRADSPWYESVRLFRQDGDRSWEPVLARISAELAALARPESSEGR